MSDTDHLIDKITALERELRQVKEDRDHWQRLFHYEANQRLQMLRWQKDFLGKGVAQ